GGTLEASWAIIIASFVLAGILQVLGGLLKLGKYIRYVPYPVISGFMTGVGVIIILLQLFPAFGLDGSGKKVTDVVFDFGTAISSMNVTALIITAITILLIYIVPSVTKVVPSTLVALVLVTVGCVAFGVEVPSIGEIPSGIPKFRAEEMFNLPVEHIWTILEFGAMLAGLGIIDSLMTSVIADNITKTRHNSDQELVGQGIGNVVSGIFGGLPGAGATMRTVVNINAGGKTRVSGMIHGVFLVIVLLGAGKYAAFVPHSVLAGILITVGIGIIDYKGLRHLRHVPRADGAVLIIVLFLTVFGNLIHAVGVGVILASILFMKNASEQAERGTSIQDMVGGGDEDLWEDEENTYREFREKVFIKHLYGPMFFGFTSQFLQMIKALDPEIKVLIIRMDNVPYIDQSGLYAMQEAIMSLHKQNVPVLLTGVESQPLDMMSKIDIVPDLLPEDHIFRDFAECEEWLKKHLHHNSNIDPMVRDIED
ncbi:MAG: SulP family inorganic anion transporter, partial [Flavobacteriales bacterium]|nr:SulP family inorganic anion transporter [Flavobacteriales bacterium]